MTALRLGTRRSALATTQSTWVADRLRALGHEVELVEVSTEGDLDRTTPLAQLGGTGVFVSALRTALAEGRVDLAVHSLKDLPTTPDDATTIAAVPTREDPRDALVARDGLTLGELPAGATVGTGSPRRRAQLEALGLGLVVTGLRGNVDTRLRAVSEGRLDAVVLAAAGLRRLGRIDQATELLDPIQMLPAPGQGALAVEVRADDAVTASVVARARRRRHPRLHDRRARPARRARGRVLGPGRGARRGRRGCRRPRAVAARRRHRPPTAPPTCAARSSATSPTRPSSGVASPASCSRTAPPTSCPTHPRCPPPTTSLRSVPCEPLALDHPAPTRIPARVVFVGAGPGDPGLLTVRAGELLAAADAVVIDQVAREAVVDRWCRPDVDVVDAGYGDHGERLTHAVRAKLVVRAAKAHPGGLVVRLMDGDPAVFNGLAEEASACVKAGLAFEVVPGVSSVTAVPSYAGVPLTSSTSTGIHVVVAGARTTDLGGRASTPGVTVVVLGQPDRAAEALDALVAAGRDRRHPRRRHRARHQHRAAHRRDDARGAAGRRWPTGASPCWPSWGPL